MAVVHSACLPCWHMLTQPAAPQQQCSCRRSCIISMLSDMTEDLCSLARSERGDVWIAGHTAFAAGELSSARFLSLDLTGGGVVSCGTLACACKVCQQPCCMQRKTARQCITCLQHAQPNGNRGTGATCIWTTMQQPGTVVSMYQALSLTVTADKTMPPDSDVLASQQLRSLQTSCSGR